MVNFTHMLFGTNDLDRARRFYDAVLTPLGFRRDRDIEDRSYWNGGGPNFAIGPPRNGEPATVANGGTLGFAAPTSAAVEAFHSAGLEAGGTCEGPPGPRPHRPGAYGAYLRDPDGNKICAFVVTSQPQP